MGTRNMTMVIDKAGEIKVAQYGQWDGYPSGVGASILGFLKNPELVEGLLKNLLKTRFIDDRAEDKKMLEEYNKNAPEWSNEPDNRTDEQKRWWKLYQTRDLADEVLTNIANSTDPEILLQDRQNTAKKDGWVEYSYVINFKENTLTVSNMLDTPALKVYKLDKLPSEEDFIKELEGEDEE